MSNRPDIRKYKQVNGPQSKFSIAYFVVPIIIIAGTFLIIWQLQSPEPSPYAHCPKSKYFDPEIASHDMSDGGTGFEDNKVSFIRRKNTCATPLIVSVER
jgi:hypothetical protein